MFSFEPSQEQKMLIEAVNRFAQNDLRPKAHDADEDANLPADLVETGWELGVLQASMPEKYGGFGEYSVVTSVLAAEELAWGDLAGALAISTPGLFAMPIFLVGNEDQKQRYLPAITESEWMPYTAALIEPDFDYDAHDLRTSVVEDGDDFVINGEKAYVPFAEDAQGMILYANFNGETQGFILPGEIEGTEVVERMKLLGIYALPVYKVKFENLRIPKENRLGGPGGHDFSPVFDASCVGLAAMAVGMSRAALEYAVDYAREREVFGVKVAQKQAIAFMLAEMATEIEAIRLLVWEAAWMLDQEHPEASKTAYLALTGAADMAMMVTDRAVQVLGGHGYIREHPVEMWMRNGRGIAMMNGLAIV
ncbi:acyl-CoA dehydrogenase family protein [Chloroflexota bacterium]